MSGVVAVALRSSAIGKRAYNNWDTDGAICIDHTSSNHEFFHRISTKRLDVALVEIQGFHHFDFQSIVSRLKLDYGVTQPIAACSASVSETRIVNSIYAGADQHFNLGMSAKEFEARIGALLRRPASRPIKSIQNFGPFHLDNRSRVLKVDGVKVLLSSLECRFLNVLFRSCGAPVALDLVLSEVWGIDDLDADSSRAHTLAARLRRKALLCGKSGWVIKSRHGYFSLQPDSL